MFNNCLNKKLITPNGVEFVVMNEFAIPGDNDQSETEKMISVRDYLAGEAEQTALNAASVAVDRDFFCAIENYYSPVDVNNTDNRPVQPSRLYLEFYVPARQAICRGYKLSGSSADRAVYSGAACCVDFNGLVPLAGGCVDAGCNNKTFALKGKCRN